MLKSKIVLIEDHEEMRDNIKEILELSDYTVFDAPNGKVGVELIQEHLPDLIICDIMMPELDGYGVLKIISSKEDTKHIPFIFLTAKAEKSDFREGMNLGADDYLTKPFSDLSLLQAVEVRLNRARSISSKYSRDSTGLNAFLSDAKDFSKLENLSNESRLLTFKKGEILYKEGQYPREVFMLASGQAKSVLINEDGKEYISGVYGKGDFIGYDALLENQPYHETLIAMSELTTHTVSKDDFLQLIYSDGQTSKSFIKLLANDVRKTEERLLQQAYQSVRKRVAETLLEMHKKYNPDNEAGLFMNIKRDDIAAHAGTAKETVIRTISDFKEEGLVEVTKAGILLKNISSLQNLYG